MFKLKDATSALSYAEYFAKLPLREVGVKNRSRTIDDLCALVGYPAPSDKKVPGLPYCAIGVCACFLYYDLGHVGTGRAFSKTASSQAIRRYFETKEWFDHNPDRLLTWKGAVGGWTNFPDDQHGHVFFVKGRLTNSAGKVTGIRTIEFNSDLAGERDGDGCYELVRRRLGNGLWRVEDALGRPWGKARRLWFCDTTLFKGGQWWPQSA